MASPAAVLSIYVNAQTQQATAALARTDAQLKKTTTSANAASTAMGSKLKSAAKTGALALGATFAYGAYKAVDAGVQFEKQMDSLGAVSSATAKDMKKLENQALRLGQKTAYSASEAAQAQIELAKGGLQVKQILGGALPAALSLAAAGELELGEAASTTVNAMKLFGLQARDATKVADMLATAANTTTADVEDFAMALRQGGSAAKAAGLDMNETVTILEALAAAGIKNSDAGTSMKTAMLQLIAPTATQAAKAKELGLNFIDANGELKNAAGISKELRGALDGMTKSQQAANLKILAGTDGFRTLSALYDAGPEKLRKYSKANAEQGTASEIAAKKMDNTAGSLEELSGAFETLGIKLFQNVQPQFRTAVDAMTAAVVELTKIGKSKTFKSLTEDLTTLAQFMQRYLLPVVKFAVEGIIIVFKNMARVLGGIIHTVASLIRGDWAEAWEGAKDIVEGVFGGIVGTIRHALGPIREAVVAIGGVMKRVLTGAWTVITTVFRKGGDIILGVFTTILDGLVATADAASNLPGPLGDAFDKIQTAAEDARDDLNTYRETLRDTEKTSDKIDFRPLRKNFDIVGAVANKTAKRLADFAGDSADRLDSFQKRSKDSIFDVSGYFDRFSGKTRTMAVKVSSNITDAAKAVTGGLSVIGSNTNEALKGFGVKQINFAFKTVTGAAAAGANAVKKQRGGVIVPGQGDGDKIPALLEPGEVVINKKAAAAMGGSRKVNRLNQMIPRFQKGGVAGSMSAMVGLVNKYERASYPYLWGGGHGGFVNGSSPVDCSGFVSDVLHAGGLLDGAPMVSGSLASWGKPASGNENLVVYANPTHTLMSLNGRYAGTSSTNPGGGAGWLSDQSSGYLASFSKRTMDVVGGMVAKEIAKMQMKGKGPLKNIGQKAFDKVWGAANKYLASKQGGAFGGGQPLKDLPAALAKYNKQYPEAPAPSHLTAPKLPFNVAAAIAEWSGTPGISMAKTQIGESALAPGASGIDPGGTKGLGMAMITTGFNDALIARLGGQNAMFNPIINNQAAKEIWDSQGWGAWYSQTKDTSNTHYTGSLLRNQRGGIVQKFAAGGIPTNIGKGPSAMGANTGADPKFMRGYKALSLAQRIRGRLGKLIGEKGRIAHIDERIAVAGDLAALASSPAGEDLSVAEKAKIVRLNETLLKTLEKQQAFDLQGLSITKRGMKYSTGATQSKLKGLNAFFGADLVGVQGVTGKGGRLHDVMLTLSDLKSSPTGSGAANPLDIAGLRGLLEAARFGVFDGMFAKGGKIKSGHWGIAGERGPEIVHGPATVTPVGGETFVGYANIDLGDGIRQRVRMEFSKRERDMALAERAGA